MSKDIELAFAHPEARARATAQPGDLSDPLDRISLRDHVVSVEIGAFQAERGTTQRISFNIVVEVRLPVDAGDDVDRILSYDRVTEAIEGALAEERLNLLETLAERVAERILLEPQAERVFVRIEKLDRGAGALGVEIVRRRAEPVRGAESDFDDSLGPRVVFLSNAAISSPHLMGWLDQLGAGGSPVVLCVSAASEPAPVAAHPAAQRRIDLLAIEQNAWVLAGRDPRCVVLDTRTELDWAMKQGQISVWAPSKLVLDALDSPLDLTRDSVALSLWLAEKISASEVILIGGNPPPGSQFALRVCDVTQARL